MKRVSEWLAATGIVLAVILVTLVILDVNFRAYEKRTFIKTVDSKAQVFDLKDLGFNDHGPPLARSKPAGEFRILNIGDSFAHAITKPAYSYSAVMEKDLRRVTPGGDIRVANLGMACTSFPDYVALYSFWGRILEPDAVIFNIYTGNDFTDVKHVPFDPGLLTLEEMRLGMGVVLPHKFPLRFLDYIYAFFKAEDNTVPENEQYLSSYQPSAERYLRTMTDIAQIYVPKELPALAKSLVWAQEFMAAAKKIRDSGVKVAIVISPPHLVLDATLAREAPKGLGAAPEDLDPAMPSLILRLLAERMGMQDAIIDLYSCLTAHAARGEQLHYGTDTHWSVLGNKIVGDYLADELAQRWFGAVLSPPCSDCPLSGDSPKAGDKAARAVQTAVAALPW